MSIQHIIYLYGAKVIIITRYIALLSLIEGYYAYTCRRMNKLITTLVCASLIGGTALAQQTEGTKVLDSKSGKPIAQATISIYGPVSKHLKTAKDGSYRLSDLPNGRYTLTLSAGGYETRQIEYVKDQYHTTLPTELRLTPLPQGREGLYDDLLVSEGSDDGESGTQDRVTLLTSSKDPFLNASGYVFSTARFRNRGFDSQYSEQMLNGVAMNDLNTGYSPWSLWGGLNDVTRLQETSQSFEPIASSFGNAGVTNNVTMRPSMYGAQRRATASLSNRTYTGRLAFTWTTGEMKGGWSLALSAARRAGSGQYSYVRGQFYDAWSYFLGIEKKFDEMNSVSFIALGAPTRRGVASASTQEAYDLVGSNFYNPNIGRQGGKWRNARVRSNHEPILQLNHYYSNALSNLHLHTTFSYRFGKNAYSALNWYNAPDPRPDYYRYLPSYFTRMADPNAQDPSAAARYEELWHSDPNMRYIDWDRLYEINRLNQTTVRDASGRVLATGKKALYMVEDRHTDQREFAWATTMDWLPLSWLEVNAGGNARTNVTENYSEVADLLGADFVYDIDKFAERDFGGDPTKSQVDLNHPDRIVQKGDRFSYDYDSRINRYQAWLNLTYRLPRLDAYTALSYAHTALQRDGKQRRGLFPDNSFGYSDHIKFNDLAAKAGATYKITGYHYLQANLGYIEQAPTFRNLFISPRTRDSYISNPKSEKILTAEASYLVRLPWLRGRVTAFYTHIADHVQNVNFYDDTRASFSNYTITGIATQHAGVELGLEAKLSPTLTANAALALGQYKYANNPSYVQTIDNSNEIVDQDIVYWKGLNISGTPQTAATLGLTYYSPWYANFGINANYFGRNFVSMAPLVRTDRGRSALPERYILPEKLQDGFTVDVFASYSWRLNYNTYLRFNLSVSNLLNNKRLPNSGYEQLRIRTLRDDNGVQQLHQPFDSKISYVYGTTFFFNTSLQF